MNAEVLHVERALSPESVLAELQSRRGAANGITASALVRNITGHEGDAEERRLRLMIEHLRLEGHAVCAHPSHGYYLAANDVDLDGTCEFLVERAMTSLRQVSAMKRVALPDLRGQLGLNLQPAKETPDAGDDTQR